MLTTPEALLQTYRVRMALEPAALLEPGYRLEPAAIERLRATEVELLDGALETIPPDALHERGVRFHESIVGACRNPFFLDALRRINRVRRLLSYRSMVDARPLSTSSAASISTSSDCSSRTATRRRPRPCGRIWSRPSATSIGSGR